MKKTDEIKNIGKWGAGVRWTPLPQAEAPTEPAGETRLHYDYLYNNKRTVINAMQMKGTLQTYLQDLDRDVEETFDRLVKQTAEAENITEKLKAKDQTEWLRRMNSIRKRAEEFVLNEFVYQ